MKRPLLIEIGVEELPAIPLLKIIKDIEASWAEILKEYRLDSKFEFVYTPRRLVIIQEFIPLRQSNRKIELFGPPVDIAIKNGIPTKAGEGFAQKAGVTFDKISTITKGKKEVLYYLKEEIGEETKNLLYDMIKKWIASMKFGKMMRWGSRKDEFIRPVRWLQVRLGNDSVDVEIFGVKSDIKTYLHRMANFNSIEVNDISKYSEILSCGAVLLYPIDRKAKILAEFNILEDKNGIEIERDKTLLDEVVAITENPKALLGRFDEKFLKLPPEVIIASMKEHQRYFPVFKDFKLTNMFIVVSNALTDDYSKVISGNEKVLRPRLSDALFFYQNDLKRGLSIDGLEKIIFMEGLGSLLDKIERERKIATRLLSLYMDIVEKNTDRNSKDLTILMQEAITLAKADLMSEMVYEFTELQGLMGYYYAKALGKDELVYNAIKEQYYPVGEGAKLPTSIFSAIVAISIKLDTLLGLFSIGKIPTGSKDPFALRRAVNGIIRIVIEYNISFDIDSIINLLSDLYSDFDKDRLKEFILERVKKSFRVNPSLINAVLGSNESDINEIFKKVEALNKIVSKDSFKDNFSTFKRVANISKDIDLKQNLDIDSSLFIEDIESKLYNRYLEIINRDYIDYETKLESLFSLKELLDSYFDNVMVNIDNDKLRKNRQNMIASIYKSFKEIADIKEISI